MTQAMCVSFKKELGKAQHNFCAVGGHTFKFALYTSLAALGHTTPVYSSLEEVVGAGYASGGFTLTNVEPSHSGTVAMFTFASNPLWTGATFSASQGLLYNATSGNKAVAVYDFGGVQTVVNGDFEVILPPVTATTAFVRLV
jgi:hypothetical protein